MAKLLDKIIFSALFITIIYGITSSYIGKTQATIISAAAYSVAVLAYTAIKVRRSLSKEVTPEEACALLALMGTERQAKLLYSTVPEEYRVSLKAPYFVLEKDGKRYMVASLYKFINLTQEDIAAAYRAAVSAEVTRIIILSRARDRKTLSLGSMLPVELIYPDKRAVYRYLKKHNALPKPLAEKKRAAKVRPDFGYLSEVIFDGHKLKYYLFTAVLLTATSFLTPLKTYYLYCAALPLCMGAICLIRSAIENR